MGLPSALAPKYLGLSNFKVLTMKHLFEIGDGPEHADTLLLIYPPEAIRELNSILDRIEISKGRMPAQLHTPVKGRFCDDAKPRNV
jgi:hypothetical protein